MNVTIDVHDEHDRLRVFYDAAEALLDHPDDVLFRTDEAVSGWSPAEHLYHIGLANGRSLKAALLMAQGALPLQDHGEPNEAGRTVLTEGHFETGRYEAPDNVQPPPSVTRDDVQEALSRSRAKLDDLADHLAALSEVTGRLEHPRLGPLDGPQWMRFIRVHSEHHYAIVRDILPPDASHPE